MIKIVKYAVMYVYNNQIIGSLAVVSTLKRAKTLKKQFEKNLHLQFNSDVRVAIIKMTNEEVLEYVD